MDKSEIKAGRYAFREKRQPGVPFQQIRILEHVRGRKWKAEWIDPNPGLVDYVDSKQLVVAWKGRKAFLKDEDAKHRLIAHARENSAYHDTPIANAFQESFLGKFRNECLNQNLFHDLHDARRRIELWRVDYNEERPHSSLNYETPSAVARRSCA